MTSKTLLDRVDLDRESGRYYDPENDARESETYWTAYCGGCGEEIDVAARSEAEARAIVAAAIELDYVPMNIDRIEPRYRGLIYF